jgi:glycosyltransferase involved in cell wall biosynthesis
MKVSAIIPSRIQQGKDGSWPLEFQQQLLAKTVDDLISKAAGNFEVIVVLEGYWPDPPLRDYSNLVVIHHGQAKGMRQAINAGVSIARGDYLLNSDAHCMFSEGFDEILKADCADNWVAVPRRYSLDAENWQKRRAPIDYLYVSYPDNPGDFGGVGLNGKVWGEKNKDESLRSREIDDLLSAQGSCWFMKKDYFHELELMDHESYGYFWNEFQEIGLKCWLSGGRVIRNKKCWYAHLHKGKKYGRGYYLSKSSLVQGATYTRKWMRGEAWDKQTIPLSWLIEKFWPIPTWTEEGLQILKEMESGKFS